MRITRAILVGVFFLAFSSASNSIAQEPKSTSDDALDSLIEKLGGTDKDKSDSPSSSGDKDRAETPKDKPEDDRRNLDVIRGYQRPETAEAAAAAEP